MNRTEPGRGYRRRALAAVAFALISAMVSAQAQSVSDQFKQRTGAALPDAPADPAQFTLPPGVRIDKALSARDAVAIALWNNAALHADLARLDVSKADLVLAGQFQNPNFSLLLPVGQKPFEFLLIWPFEELVARRHRVAAAKLDVQAVTTGLVQNGLNLTRDTLGAHADLWAAEARVRTLENAAGLANRIAELTGARRNIGEGTGFEAALASADSNAAGEAAAAALGDVGVARSRLRWLMGMRNDRGSISAELDTSSPAAIPTTDSLIEMALAGRPDLRAAELNVTAATERAKWERSRVLAMLQPVLNTKQVGGIGTVTGPGINMEIPLMARNNGRRARADAEAVRTIRDYVALKDRVEQEVMEARERVLQAQTSLRRLREQTRPPVEESMRIADRAYRSGDSTLLDVLESSRRLIAVELGEIEARRALARALADLERAIGRTL